MAGTTRARTVLNLKLIIEKAEQGILDDVTDRESLLDMEIDSRGIERTLSEPLARAIAKAAGEPAGADQRCTTDRGHVDETTRSATTPR